eukprot:945537-Prymnesium_polylepis.1
MMWCDDSAAAPPPSAAGDCSAAPPPPPSQPPSLSDLPRIHERELEDVFPIKQKLADAKAMRKMGVIRDLQFEWAAAAGVVFVRATCLSSDRASSYDVELELQRPPRPLIHSRSCTCPDFAGRCAVAPPGDGLAPPICKHLAMLMLELQYRAAAPPVPPPVPPAAYGAPSCGGGLSALPGAASVVGSAAGAAHAPAAVVHGAAGAAPPPAAAAARVAAASSRTTIQLGDGESSSETEDEHLDQRGGLPVRAAVAAPSAAASAPADRAPGPRRLPSWGKKEEAKNEEGKKRGAGAHDGGERSAKAARTATTDEYTRALLAAKPTADARALPPAGGLMPLARPVSLERLLQVARGTLERSGVTLPRPPTEPAVPVRAGACAPPPPIGSRGLDCGAAAGTRRAPPRRERRTFCLAPTAVRVRSLVPPAGSMGRRQGKAKMRAAMYGDEPAASEPPATASAVGASGSSAALGAAAASSSTSSAATAADADAT